MLQTSLSKELLSAKRGKNERSGVHAWHPYYAGYSEKFVTSAINYLELDKTHLILDPWNGSGTTGLVSSRLGLTSIGCDVNPVMNIFASAKNGYLLNHRPKLLDVFQVIKNNALDIAVEVHNEDPLLDFASTSLCKSIKALYLCIRRTKYNSCVKSRLVKDSLYPKVETLDPFESFFKSVLFVTARKLAGYKGGSNPTWVKTLENKPAYTFKKVVVEFESNIISMLDDLHASGALKNKHPLHWSIQANSKNLPVRDSSIDAIITSPPYLTRIDYAMSTRPEILVLGDSDYLRTIREETTGAPVIVDKNIESNDTWGRTCVNVLRAIQQHSSKASRSYYLPNMLQYFRDINYSIREINRVLKVGKIALIVVQSSYFKEIEIDLGQIFVEMGKELGLKSRIENREVVRGHMAHVNTKSNKYKSRKVYYEDVILFSK